MDSRLRKLMESFNEIPVVKKGDYHYFVHPLSDGVPRINPGMLSEAAGCVADIIFEMTQVDLLITAEAMGIPLVSAISLSSGIPFSVARKRSYGLPEEITVEQRTGYSTSFLYLNLPASVGNLVMVDDVLSTGGTLRAVTEGVRKTGWRISGAVVLFNKMGIRIRDLQEELGFPVLALLDVELTGNGFTALIHKQGIENDPGP